MYLFDLPRDLLDILILRTIELEGHLSRPQTPPTHIPEQDPRRLLCSICAGTAFSDLAQQRAHYRSDWHRYNIKAKLSGKMVVSESEFSNLVEGLSDSLSGSESTSEGEDDSDTDRVGQLLARSKLTKSSRPSTPTPITIPRTALACFHSAPSTQLRVYNAVFPQKMEQGECVSELKLMQEPKPEGRLWTMIMIAGGHFAAIVVRVQNPIEEEPAASLIKGKQRKPRQDYEILLHKTFHRYTTRRKQGGSQSVNDNAKGPAKSAGAMLRRYGEQALRDDVRNLMSSLEWTAAIAASERIWIRASVSNKRIFYDYDGATFAKNDPRLRTFPFPTRRPTQSELIRCLGELTRVKVSHFTEEDLREQDEAFLASLPKPKPLPSATSIASPKVPKVEVPKLTKEQEVLKEKWRRILEMVRKGRLDAIKSFWSREGESIGGVDARVPDWAEKDDAGFTLLQVAASVGQEEVVEWLLEQLEADPTLPSDGQMDATKTRRVAYDLASSKGVRDVFRRAAGGMPSRWDWLGVGHVPSVLTQEMEAEQDQKKKVRRKGLKEKMKEREEREKAAVEEDPGPAPAPVLRAAPSAGPQRLGGNRVIGGSDGLAPEMKMKIERERRARAIEARLKGGN